MLYPPLLESKLQANSGVTLKFPYRMNRAVSSIEVKGFRALVKTVQNGTKVTELYSAASWGDEFVASFNLDETELAKFNLGQYYKVQLAYVDHSDETGYYSTVGVFKYTSLPTLSIPSIGTESYYIPGEFVGTYDQTADGHDKTEKIYSYQFNLYDASGELLETSGEQLHNSQMDTIIGRTSDTWTLLRDLEEGSPHKLEYSVTTINGIKSAISATIIPREGIDYDFGCSLLAENDYDEGYVAVSLLPKASGKILSGSFILCRASEEDDYTTWNKVHSFALTYKILDSSKEHLWNDFTVKQGIRYKYSLQAYNANGLFSNRLVNEEPVVADFEDMFLFDGNRQLRLRFNPKVSSFKQTVLETKVDTLGGKYPFIFRNGNVAYREFSLSTLVSLLTDEQGKFTKGLDELARTSTPSANFELISLRNWVNTENLRDERDFKMEVLEWLNNGKPKLFRSPAEGNYIVRLINVSMTPQDTLSRMIHTVNATAYEIADCSFDNLNSYGFITSLLVMNNKTLIPAQIQAKNGSITLPDGTRAYKLSLNEWPVGTIVELTFENFGAVKIQIGETGNYYVPIPDDVVTGLKIDSGSVYDRSTINYLYYDEQPNDNFSAVSNMYITDEIIQLIGTDSSNLIEKKYTKSNVLKEIDLSKMVNIIEAKLEDIRTQAGNFLYLELNQRDIEEVYEQGDKIFSKDYDGNDIITLTNAFVIYKVHRKSGAVHYIYDINNISYSALEPNYYCQIDERILDMGGQTGALQKSFENVYNDDTLTEEPFVMSRIEAYTNLGAVENFKLGNGVCADLVYRKKILEYDIETSISSIANTKANWEVARNSYLAATTDVNISAEAVATFYENMIYAYGLYIKELEKQFNLIY